LVYEYLIDPAHLRDGTFTRLDSNFLQHTVGSQATMQACDLNADGKLEYITGCSRGGLQLFSETVWDSSVLSIPNIEPAADKSIKVFPNPADARFTCVVSGNTGALQPQLFNLLGERVIIPYTINHNTIQFSTQTLSAGMYILQVVWGSQSVTAKIIIEHSK
jgi:hypothetical protein